MPENRFSKYTQAQPASGNRFAKYAPPDQERDKIISAYAEDIIRRNTVYGGIPREQLRQPDKLWKLATLEAERAGYKPPEVNKQDNASSFALGYGQGGTFGFADELSGAVDFVGAAGPRVMYGDFQGGIEKGKQAYSDRVQKDRTLLNAARYDNPLTTTAGELTGGVVTYLPAPAGWMGAGARTTGQVAIQTGAKADKLAKLATAATGARSAKLSAQAAALKAKSARLALPATTMSQAAGRFGGRVAEGVGKGIAYGAAYGGLYGFGSAEGDAGDRLDETAQGALMGGATGGVLSPAVQFVAAPIVGRVGYGMFTSADNKALDIIIKRAERSGTSLQKVQQDFDAWAKTGEVPETLAELMGPNERSLLSALITVNRETREQAAGVFVDRGRGEVNRLEDAFAKSFGARRGDYAKAQSDAIKARVEDPEPLYAAAHFDQTGTLKPLNPQKQSSLNNILADEDDIGRIVKDAAADLNRMGHKAARDEVKVYGEALQAARRGERVQIPQLSVQAADYIERAINQSYKAAGGGTTEISGSISGWRALRNNVRAIIDDTGVGDARATSAERIRRGELLEEGLNVTKPSVDVDDVNRVMTGIPDAGIPAASVEGRRAYGVGASRAVANELRNVPDMAGFADATRKVARTPALRDKLEAARPKVLTKKGAENKGSRQTKANAALDEAIERASNRAQFGVDMVGNSKTAFRQGDVEDAVLDDAISSQMGQSLSDLLITGVGGAGNQIRDRLARTIGNRLGQPSIYRPNINRAAANVLLATGDEIPKQVARLAARAANRKVSRITMRGLPPPPGGSSPSTPPRATPPTGGGRGPRNAPPPAPTGAGPIRAGGFAGFGGRPANAFDPETPLFRGSDDAAGGLDGPQNPDGWHGAGIYLTTSADDAGKYSTRGAGKRAELMDDQIALAERAGDQEAVARLTAQRDRVAQPGTPSVKELRAQMKNPVTLDNDGGTVWQTADANRLIDALVSEVDDAGITYGASIGQKLRAQLQKDGRLTASDFERIVRAEADADFIRAETSPGQVISQAYQALGHDGVVMKNASDVLPKGSTPKGTTHVTVFDKTLVTPPGTRSSGLSGLRTDAGPGAVGGFIGFNQDGEPITADNIGEKLRNAAIGTGVGLAANRIGPRSVGKPRNALADTATAGIGGGGRGPRKPTVGKPKRDIGTKVADATAIAALGIAPPAEGQSGASAELEAAKQRVTQIETREIPRLESDLRLLEAPATDPKVLQDVLQRRGFDLGPAGIDGKIGPDTRKAIADNVKQIRQDIETQRKELERARASVKEAQIRAARQKNEPNATGDLLSKAASLTAFAGASYLAYRGRRGAVAKAVPVAQSAARKANSLLNKNKLSTAKTGADSLNTRAGNINEFWRQGGAGRNVPFQADDQGKWSARPGAKEASQLYKNPPLLLGGDTKMMATAAADAGVARWTIVEQEKAIEKADADIAKYEAAGDVLAAEAAYARKRNAEAILITAQVAEKLGWGYLVGRTTSAVGMRYPRVSPRMADAEAERALLLQAMSKPAKPAPPPKPKKTP